MSTVLEHARVALMFARLGMLDFAHRRIMDALREANRIKADPRTKSSLFRMMNWLRAELARGKA